VVPISDLDVVPNMNQAQFQKYKDKRIRLKPKEIEVIIKGLDLIVEEGKQEYPWEIRSIAWDLRRRLKYGHRGGTGRRLNLDEKENDRK